MPTRPARTRTASRLARTGFAFAASTLILGLVAPSVAFGQERLPDIVAYEAPENATLSIDGWVDPAVTFGLDPASLVPIPDEADFSEIRRSTVLAAGIEDVSVDDDIATPFEERYLRIRQIQDTLIRDIGQDIEQIRATELDISTTEIAITESEKEADAINILIDAERAEEERLADEIFTRDRAIAEFAIRAFTGEDQLEILIDEPDTESTKTRVVTAEVREELFLQIAQREVETAEHVAQRLTLEDDVAIVEEEIAGFEDDIRGFEQDIADLEAHIDQLDEFYTESELLAEVVADDLEVAVHARLTGFVVDSDLPYVALNAYLIAARTLETEDPQCQIHWSQLAGIGRIESFHGYFANSTLDVDGHTTEDILGLPLDGRILSGAEFIEEGAEAPEATGRTEEQAVPVATPPAAEPAAPAAAPAAETPAPATDGANEGEAAAAPAPARVIKTLALILDTDDGVLDGDTEFDRAVGPMQFIPTTWDLFDADGNGDGETDPQNIYDAALASARYLCASTDTMTTEAGEQRAYFAYNHDLDYSRNVTNAGRGYRAEITIDSPEIEESSGRYYLGISEGYTAENEPLEVPEDGEASVPTPVSELIRAGELPLAAPAE